MKPVLLIDFGSTYTKVTAADVDEGRLLGTANAYTTVQSDINNGLSDALSKLEKVTGKLDFCERYAASSAAGGLRMLASGLVPELTAEAAKCASLGAGAKVLKTYAFKLNEDDADEIKAINPDIFLLVGGTDGGNTDCILHNAHVLADIGGAFGDIGPAGLGAVILPGGRSLRFTGQLVVISQVGVNVAGGHLAGGNRTNGSGGSGLAVAAHEHAGQLRHGGLVGQHGHAPSPQQRVIGRRVGHADFHLRRSGEGCKNGEYKDKNRSLHRAKIIFCTEKCYLCGKAPLP